ncbi:MAG TPA: DUF308 domain-containing protein [Candidatus Saccharimonadia bacterium]|nr:DUF308 domain-containing protein [Candidatus Saccharimonadia bacterium]
METEVGRLTNSLIIRGILGILFGVAAVFWPGITLVTLVYLFSAFVLVGGLAELINGIGGVASAKNSVMTRVLRLLFGALEIGVGVYLLRHVHVAFATLILIIGFTLIVRGVLEVVEGLFEEGPAMYKFLMVCVGLLAVLAGIVVLFQPVASGVAFVWVLGIYSLITGPLFIAGAVEMNNLAKGRKPAR